MSVHLEGRFSVLAAIAAGRRKIESILIRDDADPDKVADVLAAAKDKKIPVQKRTMAALEELTHGKTHGGVVAVCAPRPPEGEAELFKILDAEKTPFVLLLEGVDDDRNLAFTLRTAEALGVDAVILKKKEWDLDEADVCRSSSGAFERLCIVQIDREGDLVERLKKRGLALVGCVPHVLGTVHDAPLAGPLVLAVGGEKRGLSAALRQQCTAFARIPMKAGAATSLSMSHAAAIAMAEVLRQRTVSKKKP